MRYHKVQDNPFLGRVSDGTLVNTNTAEIEAYRSRKIARDRLNTLEMIVDELQDNIREIKERLSELGYAKDS